MPAVQVDGLAEFVAALRIVEAGLPKAVTTANRHAADVIAEAARASYASRTGVAPKVAPSVKVLAQQRGAAIRIGGDNWPYALGSEFGSFHFKQFPAWKGSKGDAGYSLFPAIRDKKDEAERVLETELTALVKIAWPR